MAKINLNTKLVKEKLDRISAQGPKAQREGTPTPPQPPETF